MKLVYFIDHLRPDGTQFFLCQLVSGLAARGHRQSVVCLNGSFDDAQLGRLQAAGVEIRVVGKMAICGVYGWFAIWWFIRRQNFDVAVTLLFFSDVIGRLLSKWGKVPRVVSSLRARNINYSGLQRRLVRSTMWIADAVVINSAGIREFAIAEEGALEDRIELIPNGVVVENYTSAVEPRRVRSQLGVSDSCVLIAAVGRLTRQKGFDTLMHAMSLLTRRDVNLVLYGVGEEEVSLRGLAHQLSLNDRVHFAGFRRDIPSLLGAMDIYVHPSRFEGMPNALLEAMASACPIVATDVDGNRELISDGIHGWLVPPDNAELLAAAIAAALNDPDEARRRGRAARQRVATQFSVEAMITAWEKVLLGRQ